jgi:hypothetical protein
MTAELREEWRLTPNACVTLEEPIVAQDYRYSKPVVQITNIVLDSPVVDHMHVVSPSNYAFSRF